MFVRSAIFDDVYCPYAYEEVEKLVTPEVSARLDQGQRYGIFWHNIKRNTCKQVAETGLNGKSYRKKRKTTPKPREEWMAVPDSGRELSGGLLRCGHCDANMRNFTTLGSRDLDVRYFYYRCARRAQRRAARRARTGNCTPPPTWSAGSGNSSATYSPTPTSYGPIWTR